MSACDAQDLTSWLTLARANGHRLPVLLDCGDSDAGPYVHQCLAAAACEDALLLAAAPLAGLEPVRRPVSLLGTEQSALVVVLDSTMDPNALGMLAGTLGVGGLLLMVRSGSLPESPFVRRLCQQFQTDPACGLLGDKRRAPVFTPGSVNSQEAREEQVRAVDAVLHSLHGRRPPVVLRSARGRGKSTVLGRVAATCLNEGRGQVALIGPRQEAVGNALAALRHCLNADSQAEPAFVPPDAALQLDPTGTIALVDEAAAIPPAVLERLLQHFPRIAFATTVAGYEGSGRGFELRFAKELDRRAPGWRWLDLRHPWRWQVEDPLEALLDRALLMQPEMGGTELSQTGGSGGVIEALKQEALMADESLLQQVAGLLMTAHYRTRPSDFMRLLDDPAVRLWVAREGAQLTGVLLGLREGPVDSALAEAIHRGQRRPDADLLCQTLIHHGDCPEAADWRGLRVWRIAVAPACQRAGIGRALLAAAARDSQAQGFDWCGSSFAFEPGVAAFWRAAGFKVLRIGTRRDSHSGSVAMQVGLGWRPPVQAVMATMSARTAGDLPWLLGDSLADLAPRTALELLRCVDSSGSVPGAAVRRYAAGEMAYEPASPALWRWLSGVGADSGDEDGRALAVARVLQRHSWDACARHFSLTGRRGVEAALRQALSSMISSASDTGRSD